VKAIFFDMDGTSIDSLPVHIDFLKDMSKKFNLNLDLPSKDNGRRIAASPMSAVFRKAGFPEELIPELNEIYKTSFKENYSVKPFRGIKEVWKALKEKGFIIGIVTSNHLGNIKSALGEDTTKLFDLIYTADNKDAIGKANQLKDALSKLNLSADQLIYVGDVMKDYNAAKEAGVKFIGVTYGWEIEKNDEFATVDSVEELKKRLLNA